MLLVGSVAVETIKLVRETPVAIGGFHQVRHAFKSWANFGTENCGAIPAKALFPVAAWTHKTVPENKDITIIDLSWSIELGPKAKKVIEFSYSVEWPKGKEIAGGL